MEHDTKAPFPRFKSQAFCLNHQVEIHPEIWTILCYSFFLWWRTKHFIIFRCFSPVSIQQLSHLTVNPFHLINCHVKFLFFKKIVEISLYWNWHWGISLFSGTAINYTWECLLTGGSVCIFYQIKLPKDDINQI